MRDLVITYPYLRKIEVYQCFILMIMAPAHAKVCLSDYQIYFSSEHFKFFITFRDDNDASIQWFFFQALNSINISHKWLWWHHMPDFLDLDDQVSLYIYLEDNWNLSISCTHDDTNISFYFISLSWKNYMCMPRSHDDDNDDDGDTNKCIKSSAWHQISLWLGRMRIFQYLVLIMR